MIGIKKVILFFLLFINFMYAENWVGKAATLQIIEGTKLADGSTFSREDLIAACNGFKIGAEVNIVNPKNGKNITVTIKDRIDTDKEYFILISQKASHEIDLEWDTSLVIVEGKFSDVNSTERLDINGLVKEGELDPETVKRFPDINWPNEEKVITADNSKDLTIITPKTEKQETPDIKEKQNKIDVDDKNGYKILEEKQYQDIPLTEKEVLPEEKMKQFMISSDDNVEQKKVIIAMNDTNKVEDKKTPEDKKEDPKIIVNWEKELGKGKIYIRISTAFNKNEGERRYKLFSMIFPSIIGIEENNKYILFVGPIDAEKVDSSLNKIKSFGFKDAYIIKK